MDRCYVRTRDTALRSILPVRSSPVVTGRVHLEPGQDGLGLLGVGVWEAVLSAARLARVKVNEDRRGRWAGLPSQPRTSAVTLLRSSEGVMVRIPVDLTLTTASSGHLEKARLKSCKQRAPY